MTCYHPLRAYRAPANGGVSFSRQRGFSDLPVDLPCGQCIGCRLERSRQWAVRCMHEASLYENNCFLTLTYSDLNLPAFSSLNVRHFQLFMKKLRKKYYPGIRFFHCGEYGDTTDRPHYHALIFNFDFPDKELYSTNRDGHRLYTSSSLDKLWPLGHSVIGSVSFQSAAYVARYCVKKVTGDFADAYYEVVDSQSGQIGRRQPEYATMSRRPGIGSAWYGKYSSEVFPSDFVVLNGAKMRPPKAYNRFLERDDPKLLARVRGQRVLQAKKHAADNTADRLAVREEVQISRAKILKRGLE